MSSLCGSRIQVHHFGFYYSIFFLKRWACVLFTHSSLCADISWIHTTNASYYSCVFFVLMEILARCLILKALLLFLLLYLLAVFIQFYVFELKGDWHLLKINPNFFAINWNLEGLWKLFLLEKCFEFVNFFIWLFKGFFFFINKLRLWWITLDTIMEVYEGETNGQSLGTLNFWKQSKNVLYQS